MFREMRRKNQLLPEEYSVEILKKGISGVLALLGDDDFPYAVPMSYIYEDGKFYLHSARTGHKIDAIKKHGKASFCVICLDIEHMTGKEAIELVRTREKQSK